MHSIEHSLMGHLDWSATTTTSDWSGSIVMPGFAECYEKWESDGTEFFRDRRTDDHRQGRFPFVVNSGSPLIGFGHGKTITEYREPSSAQCAAYSALVSEHETVAESLKQELATYVSERDRAWCDLTDEEFGMLVQPEMILGTLELQHVSITYHESLGFALVGLAFHSEIWDCEHGIGAVVHGDRVIRLGAAEDSDPQSMRIDDL